MYRMNYAMCRQHWGILRACKRMSNEDDEAVVCICSRDAGGGHVHNYLRKKTGGVGLLRPAVVLEEQWGLKTSRVVQSRIFRP